jgi:endonuclease/exonuclease/phosphatase family metal-dependent hydrolase
MGDLNEWSAHGGCLRDFAHHMKFADCGRSFHVRGLVAQLDRIMVSQEIELLGSGAHDSRASRKASDHLPIWAEIGIS